MSSKLGIIAIEWQSDAIGWAIQNKPTAFEFMMTQPLDSRPMYDVGTGGKVSQIEAVKILAENSPKTLLIIRAYPDDYDHSDFQDRMLKWSEPFRAVSDRVVAHSVNEPTIFNPDDAKRLNEYEVGFIRRMAAEGLLPMCFCLSESHLVGPTLNDNGTIKDWGNLPLWWYMKDGMALLAEKHGFWGLNEYDWSSWCASRDRGRKWRLGHWEVNLDVLQRHLAPSQIPLIGIGEGILDGKIWTSRLPQSDHRYNKPWGWQYAKSSPQYLADIKGIYAESYQNPRIAFHLMFAWAPNHRDWGTYDVSRMKDLLAQYLQENLPIYWEPNGGIDMALPEWIIDLRDTLKKHPTKKYATRLLSQIDTIVIHHTATTFAAPETIANWHVDSYDWPGAGYHVYIRKNGKIYLMNSLETESYHTFGHNNHTLALTFEGDFTKDSVIEAQVELGKKVVEWIEKCLGTLSIRGHKDMPGQSTACPGYFPVQKLKEGELPPTSNWEALYKDLRTRANGVIAPIREIKSQLENIEKFLK